VAQWSAIIEMMGEDVQEMVAAADSLQAPERSVNEFFLKSMSRCKVDDNCSILWDAALRFGPMLVMLVPAAFCKPVAGAMRGLPMVKGQPECGERPLESAEFVSGRVLLLRRGRTTFAQKYKLALSLGAAALIVAQTLDVWPFVMTDSAGEIEAAGGESGAEAAMPCYMISKADARLLETLYAQAPLGARAGDDPARPSALHIVTRDPVRECSICQEPLQVGETALKLHCRHVYHDACVAAWLRTKSTCPLCREEQPAGQPTPTAGTSRSEGGPAGSAAGSQPYYV